MYRHCATEETAQRQRQLEQCLLSLMLRKRYHSISVRELCAEACISRMAFYQYFDSKDDALDALIDHTLQDFGSFDCTKDELERFAHYWKLQQPLLDALHLNQLDELLTTRSLQLISAEDHDFRRRFGPELEEYDEMLLRFTVQGIISIIQSWHQSQYQLSANQIAALLHRALMQPLMAEQHNATSGPF